MTRARRLFVGLLGAALVLSAAAAWLSVGPSDFGSTRSLVRFVVFVLAIGATAATWGTAVMIASVYRVVWPLVAATTMLLAGIATTVAWWAAGR